MLYTSHLLDVVERVCDRMIVLRSGERVADGTLEELRERSHGGSAGAESLETIFQALTESEDPADVARRILG